MDRWCSQCAIAIPLSEWAKHQRQHHDQASPRKGSTREWRKQRDRIIERDGGQCTYPGCHTTTCLEVHHVDGDWRHNHDSNLTTRCAKHNPRGRPRRSKPT